MMDRRTVVKGAAWAVPAITVAAMAPAIAASSSTGEYTMVGTACKAPGNADAPAGYDKQSYKVTLFITPEANSVVPEYVTNNAGGETILSSVVKMGNQYSFTVDATSSGGDLTGSVNIDGALYPLSIHADPHCGKK